MNKLIELLIELYKDSSDDIRRVTKIILFVVIPIFFITLLAFQEYDNFQKNEAVRTMEDKKLKLTNEKLSSLYTQLYRTDSLHSLDSRRRILNEINLLKNDQLESSKNSNSDFFSTSIFKNGFLALFFIIIITVLKLFMDIRPTNDDENKQTSNKISQIKEQLQEEYNFITWAIENEYDNKFDKFFSLAKAKEIYDLTETFGDKRAEILIKIKEYCEALSDENVEGQYDAVEENYENIISRLRDESDRHNRQGIINLFLCFIIAFAFIGYIIYQAFGYSSEFAPTGLEKTTDSVYYFLTTKLLPKLTVIIGLLTMFLYFVRLYKSSLIDAKYYQNELTNVELKYISLLTAIKLNKHELIEELSKGLMNTERNQFFQKEQTTIELEKTKLENELYKSDLERIWGVLKSIIPENKKVEKPDS